MTSIEFIDWLVNRLIIRYDEPPNADFVLKLKGLRQQIIDEEKWIHGKHIHDIYSCDFCFSLYQSGRNPDDE